ncbi:MAG: transcriptional regulator [Candidatus Aenigmarchaeota archaeon]|nr:transcriptional regulator [Candidatus Aenigmarchaeota archaeon]
MKSRIIGKEFCDLTRFLQLSPAKINIYRLLFMKPMTITSLERNTKLSERMVRGHIRDMLRKGFVERNPVIENNRLAYVYRAVSPLRALDMIEDIAKNAEKLRKEYRHQILKGTNESINKSRWAMKKL